MEIALKRYKAQASIVMGGTRNNRREQLVQFAIILTHFSRKELAENGHGEVKTVKQELYSNYNPDIKKDGIALSKIISSDH